MTTPTSTFHAVDAANYEQQMGRWSRRLAEPFLDFVGTLDGESVLDAGCGTGHLAAALARRCKPARLVGIDVADVYLASARRAVTGPGIEFRLGDACALAFADASFDRVLSMLVLHFVPDTARAVAEMRRVARPGATVGATVWDVRGGMVANRLFYDAAAGVDPEAGARRARNYTRPMTRPGELAAAWRAGGLQQVRDTSLAIRMEFASFDDYWSPYDGGDGPGGEYIAALDTDMRERVKAAVRAAYLDGEPDGPRSYAALAWAVRGVVPG